MSEANTPVGAQLLKRTADDFPMIIYWEDREVWAKEAEQPTSVGKFIKGHGQRLTCEWFQVG